VPYWGACHFALPARGQYADALLKAMSDFNAVQVIYRAAAPHTDKNGNQLARYDSQRSFFQWIARSLARSVTVFRLTDCP